MPAIIGDNNWQTWSCWVGDEEKEYWLGWNRASTEKMKNTIKKFSLLFCGKIFAFARFVILLVEKLHEQQERNIKGREITDLPHQS